MARFVEDAGRQGAAEFTLRARNPAADVTIGGKHLIFIATGGPAFASDLDRGRRAGNYADMCDFIRLVQSLNVIHQDGGTGVEPTDLPAETRHLDVYEATLTLDRQDLAVLGPGRPLRARRHRDDLHRL